MDGCSLDVFASEEAAWMAKRRRALQAGLAREARLQRPSMISQAAAAALLAVACAPVPWAARVTARATRLAHRKQS